MAFSFVLTTILHTVFSAMVMHIKVDSSANWISHKYKMCIYFRIHVCAMGKKPFRKWKKFEWLKQVLMKTAVKCDVWMKLASFAVQKYDQHQCLSERQKFKLMTMQTHSKIQRMTYKFNHQFISTKMTNQREVSASYR